MLSRKLIKPILWNGFCNLKINRKRNMLNLKCLYLIEIGYFIKSYKGTLFFNNEQDKLLIVYFQLISFPTT